ncbi:hypothetical protein AOQ73_26705 [Bradyrhizobium pachyrhizi]|nr:hypothetical protein AOQ73_26705 [Bradyrhizobium pachyrhizi]
MASTDFSQCLRGRQKELCKSIGLLAMNFSSGISRSGLALHFDFDSATSSEQIEARGACIVRKFDIPSLAHEVSSNTDFVGKRPGTKRAIHGIAQATDVWLLRTWRKCRIDATCRQQETIKRKILFAHR